MKTIKIYQRTISIFSIIVLCVCLLSQCVNKEADKVEPIKNERSKMFAGSTSCVNCHKSIFDSQVHTAHFLTSQPATKEFIKGSFDTGKNKFSYDANVAIVMQKRGAGFFQVETFKGVEKKAKQMDIVVGSGVMGQSYLSWGKNHLFQMPITFFTAANQWSNSPGYPDKIIFNRVITSRCLECHTSYAETISDPSTTGPEEFNRNQIVYGVDCEKCHGPAKQHVEFQTQNPKATTAKFIINPAKLSRQQNLDFCASCHGGRLQKTKPSFQFTIGDKLSDYFVVDTIAPDPTHVDVHGNQYALLRASKCFRMSQTMTCNTCHGPHETERGKMDLFSERCMTCHNKELGTFCKIDSHTAGFKITTNCIDCHMPLQASKAISVQIQGTDTKLSAMIRSHLIAIYPEETKKASAIMKASHQTKK